MKTSKTAPYIIQGIAAAMLVLGARISLADSASWRSLPQDSAWENASNWTPGGPPNGPSDTATFTRSSQREIDITSSVEVDSIVFTSSAGNADSFTINISPYCLGCQPPGGELIFDGTGIHIFNGLSQRIVADEGGQIIFNNTSTAGDVTIRGNTIFNDSSTAGSATLVAYGGGYFNSNSGIVFNDASSGGTARVQVFRGYPSREPNGYLFIGDHQGGVTIGSIEGDGTIALGANDLTVGTNNMNTVFSG